MAKNGAVTMAMRCQAWRRVVVWASCFIELRRPDARHSPELAGDRPDEPQLDAEAAGLGHRVLCLPSGRRTRDVGAPEHASGDAVGAHQASRWSEHEHGHDPEHDGSDDAQHGPAEGVHLRHPAAEVGPGEREAAGLLGDVDAHDALDEGGHSLFAAAGPALDVVDRVLATEDEDEEQRGEEAGEKQNAAGEEADEWRHAAYVGPGARYELVEHQRVLRLLDGLVVRVAELRGVIGELGGELEQTALEQVLELLADF